MKKLTIVQKSLNSRLLKGLINPKGSNLRFFENAMIMFTINILFLSYVFTKECTSSTDLVNDFLFQFSLK